MTPLSSEEERIARRHLRAGWWGLCIFLSLGVFLEALHGFKVGLYLDVGNETRRLLWRLAHAHGTLLSLVNIAYGLTVKSSPETATPLASAALLIALVLIPTGFFAGGIAVHGGDPGLSVMLVPVGAVALFTGVVIVARRIR